MKQGTGCVLRALSHSRPLPTTYITSHMGSAMPASLMLLTSFALVLGLGCVSGFLAGLLGVGGGTVVVPVLYHVLAAFDVDVALRAHIAVGTLLATIIPTSFQSIRTHRARGAVDT